MTRVPDPTGRLVRALRTTATASGCAVSLEPILATAWESATYSGTRHTLAAVAPASPHLFAWLAALPEIDLPMPGQFAAGICVSERIDRDGTTTFTVKALTIIA